VWVQLGNDHAVEAYRDDASDDPEQIQYRAVRGRQITAMVLPEDWSLSEAFTTVLKAAELHFDTDPATDDKHPPAWVESDSDGLAALLAEHFGIKANRRPAGWKGDHPSVAALRAGATSAG
jgi:hypothetical protein